MKLPADVKPKNLLAIHPRPIAKGTLKAILRQTELTVEELKKLLK